MSGDLHGIPANFDEFLKFEQLSSWPIEITSEGPLGIQSEGLLLGSEEDITKQLYDAGPFNTKRFDKVERDLAIIEESLYYYSDFFVTDRTKDDWIQGRLGDILNKQTFMTEVLPTDQVKEESVSPKNMVHESSVGDKPYRQSFDRLPFSVHDRHEVLLETKKRAVEYCVFPGFHSGEMIELPGQLEAPPILNLVTKAQDFNMGFRKFWKRVFLSEASVAVMQDLFWWSFLDVYKPKMVCDKDKLFDRIADSFSMLFISIHPDIKDKFLEVYPDCLAQAVYTVYIEAFPESQESFDSQFKQRLADLINEWTSGIKRMPGQWKSWNIKRLGASLPVSDHSISGVVQKMLQHSKRSTSHEQAPLTFDTTDSFKQLIDSLGQVTDDVSNQSLVPVTASVSTLPCRQQTSAMSVGATHMYKCKESHQVGPGNKLERMKFNLQGMSPLIAHSLYKTNNSNPTLPRRKVRRTEIAGAPPPRGTYQQLIDTSLDTVERLKKEYQSICDSTDAEVVKLEHAMMASNKDIALLKKELANTKNLQDLRALRHKIFITMERSRENALVMAKKS